MSHSRLSVAALAAGALSLGAARAASARRLTLASTVACLVLAAVVCLDFAGKRVGILLCGTNTDPATFARHIDAALARG